MNWDNSAVGFVWLTVAILAGGYARARNRSAWTWFLLTLLLGLLKQLHSEDTYVLRLGDLEKYYGTHGVAEGGGDKVRRAVDFCDSTKDLESFAALHPNHQVVEDELRGILGRVFADS